MRSKQVLDRFARALMLKSMSAIITPLYLSVCSRDFEELRENLAGWDHEYELMKPGGFSGYMKVADFLGTQVSLVRWGNAIRYRGTTQERSFAFGFPISQSYPGEWMGLRSTINDIIVQRPGRAAEFYAPSLWEALVVRIPERKFLRLHAVLSGSEAEISAMPHGTVSLRPSDATLLRQLARGYFRTLTSQVRAITSVAVQRRLLCDLTEQLERELVLSLINARDLELPVPNLASPDALVRKAEELARGAQQRRIGIAELCAYLDVSERALHYAFTETRGTPPAAWLRRMRLNKTYKLLRKNDPARGLVKKVALENGFMHFGRFAEQYKRHFGERPSETLHRSVGPYR